MEDPSSVSVSDAAEKKTPVLSRLKLVSNLRGDLLINVAFSERSELGGLLESRALMAITEELAGAGRRLFILFFFFCTRSPSLLWGPRGRELRLLDPLGRRMEERPSKGINQRCKLYVY